MVDVNAAKDRVAVSAGLLRPGEAAAFLRISVRKLYQLFYRDELTMVVVDNMDRFARNDLIEDAAKNRLSPKTVNPEL